MTSSYGEIVERLEKLTGADREADCIVAAATQWDGVGHAGQRWIEAWPCIRERGPYDITRSANNYRLPAYTASIDAAVALVEKKLPSAAPGVSKNVHHGHWYGWLARICPDEAAATEMFSEGMSEANAAIALLIALFRALTVNENG